MNIGEEHVNRYALCLMCYDMLGGQAFRSGPWYRHVRLIRRVRGSVSPGESPGP